MTLSEAKNNAVCYTHFITLLFEKPYYKIHSYLGPIILGPLKRFYFK